MDLKHIMIDIETLGTKPNAPVLSIGACLFTETQGITAEFHISLDVSRQIKEGRPIDFDTFTWWLSQSKEAQESLLAMVPVPLATAKEAFIDIFKAWTKDLIPEEYRVWAKPPSFDLVILKDLFGSEPWHYRTIRDLRTLLDDAGNPKIPFEGVAHNALDDAKHQAREVLCCKALLKGKGL